MPFDGLLYPARLQPPTLLPAGRFELDRSHPSLPDIAGYWPLSRDARDYSATGNHGTFVGSPPMVVGPGGPVFSGNGTTTGVSTRLINPIPAGSSYSMAAWFYPTAFAASQAFIMTQGAGGTNNHLIQLDVLPSGAVRNALWGDDFDTASGLIKLNTWNHAVITHQAGTKAITTIVNGVLAYSGTATGEYSGSGPISIGYCSSYGSTPFTGLIAGAAAWTRVIGPGEGARLFAGGVGGMLLTTGRRALASQTSAASGSSSTIIGGGVGGGGGFIL